MSEKKNQTEKQSYNHFPFYCCYTIVLRAQNRWHFISSCISGDSWIRSCVAHDSKVTDVFFFSAFDMSDEKDDGTSPNQKCKYTEVIIIGDQV